MKVSDVLLPSLAKMSPMLSLIPEYLALAGFEDTLSEAWPKELGSSG